MYTLILFVLKTRRLFIMNQTDKLYQIVLVLEFLKINYIDTLKWAK